MIAERLARNANREMRITEVIKIVVMDVYFLEVIDYGEGHTDGGEDAGVAAHFPDKPGNDGCGIATGE